jgi:hypothetical protein
MDGIKEPFQFVLQRAQGRLANDYRAIIAEEDTEKLGGYQE